MDLTNDEKITLLDFEEKCAYFGHVKLIAMEIHKVGMTDGEFKAAIGKENWKKIKRISEVSQANAQTKAPQNNQRRYRLLSSIGDTGF